MKLDQQTLFYLCFVVNFDETVQVVAQLVFFSFLFLQTFFVDFFVKKKEEKFLIGDENFLFAYCKNAKKTYFISKKTKLFICIIQPKMWRKNCVENSKLFSFIYLSIFPLSLKHAPCGAISFLSVNGGRSYSKMHLQFIRIWLFSLQYHWFFKFQITQTLVVQLHVW